MISQWIQPNDKVAWHPIRPVQTEFMWTFFWGGWDNIGEIRIFIPSENIVFPYLVCKNIYSLPGLKTTTSPQTPRPLYKYKDNTNNQLGNCDTVYCYVAAYGMDMCIASWDMCDGREQCFNGEDEKPEKCAGKDHHSQGTVSQWRRWKNQRTVQVRTITHREQCLNGEDEKTRELCW